MKTILITLLISFSALASNWMPISKIESKSSQAYQLELDCLKTGEQCIDVGSEPYAISLGFGILTPILEDDFENPIWGSRSMIVKCADETDCIAIHETRECVDGRTSFYSVDDLEVWCNKIVGYQQKDFGKKSFSIDTAAFNSYKATQSAIAQGSAIRNQIKSLRECLAGVIDLLVLRNASKNLTTEQVDQMVQTYQPIMALLQAVSGVTAKEKIQAVSADGVLVTENDKIALTQEIDKCLGN